ncbi:MAG: homoserine dehydrogenase [Planctomycetaceae bacterium]
MSSRDSVEDSKSPLRVAIVGMGTVGTAVARILTEHGERTARRAGRPIELRKSVVRDLRKSRGISLPEGVLTDDLEAVIADPEIDLAVHLIGGIEPAQEILMRLLEAGKDVVTANKAVLCQHGPELFARARELGRSISFEAAVAGGVPIISTLAQSLAANQITSIEAILNGTSNFILTEMLSRDRSYAEALREAQKRGYAEADPVMDVDGTDAAQKLVILAELAFGTRVPLAAFPRQGIDALDLADLQYARELGYTVKLLAVARLGNGELEMHVQPTLVRHDRPLAKIDGAFNMIAVEGDAVGTTWYSGPGAGGPETASAVVADVIDAAIGRAALTFPLLDVRRNSPLPLKPAEDVARRYYLRFHVEDRPHVLADIADVLGRHGISIASLIQHEADEPNGGAQSAEGADGAAIVPLVIMTHRTAEGKLRAADRELDGLAALRPPRIRMPVAD